MRTCAEAILIEVVEEGDEAPETVIRQSLTRGELEKIVCTWAEELDFDQLCTENVLD